MRRTTIEQDEFLTTSQVSEQYNIPESTLRYWRLRSEGPVSFYRSPRRVIYRRSELERWMTNQEAATARGGAA